MANQIQSVLLDSRWASRLISGDTTDISLYLATFPGVVGGNFCGKITGLTPDYDGQVDVTITCTGFDSGSDSPSPMTYFQEIESFALQNSSFEFLFRIPYEARATEEDADWHLLINFSNGTSEVFEIPVCRTPESSPKLTSVQIAAEAHKLKKHQPEKPLENSNKNRIKPYTITVSDSELDLRLPASHQGQVNSLATGLGIFAGLWAAILVIILWLTNDTPDVIYVIGCLLLVMLIFAVFLFFGESHCILDKEKLIVKHKLFGIPINWSNTTRSDLAGVSTKFLAAIPKGKKSYSKYWVVANTSESSTVLLGVSTLNQNDARMLTKQLNEFLGL